MNTGLAARVVLVTGGGRGIGRAIALAFAAEGARVAVLGRQLAPLEATCALIGEGALPVLADLADAASLDAAVTAIEAALGPIDVLVHNAARFSPRRRLGPGLGAEWQASFEANVQGVAHLSARALEGMRKRRWGRVVLVSSLLAAGGGRGYGVYASMKAAQEALVRGIALDYGAYGITANAIAPGFIATEHFEETTPEAMREAHAAAAAVGRLGRPEEVAAAAVFLASEGAAFITGATLPVGGGADLNTRW